MEPSRSAAPSPGRRPVATARRPFDRIDTLAGSGICGQRDACSHLRCTGNLPVRLRCAWTAMRGTIVVRSCSRGRPGAAGSTANCVRRHRRRLLQTLRHRGSRLTAIATRPSTWSCDADAHRPRAPGGMWQRSAPEPRALRRPRQLREFISPRRRVVSLHPHPRSLLRLRIHAVRIHDAAAARHQIDSLRARVHRQRPARRRARRAPPRQACRPHRGRRVDRGLRPEPTHQVSRLLAACRRDDTRSARCGELHGKRSDGAGRAECRHGLARRTRAWSTTPLSAVRLVTAPLPASRSVSRLGIRPALSASTAAYCASNPALS